MNHRLFIRLKNLPPESNPYVVLYKQTEGSKTKLGKTEVVKKNPNPSFSPFFISCKEMITRGKFVFECYSSDPIQHKLIGVAEVIEVYNLIQ
jgi:hypothetical protein